VLTLIVALVGVLVAAELRVLFSMAAVPLLARRTLPPCPGPPPVWPHVTVQLAVYREHRVLARLLRRIVDMEYPRNALAVQVLDDSPADDAARTLAIVNQFSHCGVRVEYVSRDSRRGYKAGALNVGLQRASSELIAYFDADCAPRPDFLIKTVPYLNDPAVAAVQARWQYTNAKHSPLTILQAAIFEGLFYFEISARARLDAPVFYMGSAAVWRRKAMLDIGGWQEAPFTAEDLDMAYRAANAGWQVRYQPEVVADSETVEAFLPFKAQQRRWARAITRVAIDNWRGVLRSSRSVFAKLIEATTLLLHVASPLTIAIAFISGVCVAGRIERTSLWVGAQWVFTTFTLASPSALWLFVGQRGFHDDWKARARLLSRATPAAAALMWSYIFGVWDELRAADREFVVTPKDGEVPVLAGSRSRWLADHYAQILVEGAFGIFAVTAGVLAAARGYYEAFLPLLALGVSSTASCAQSCTDALERAAALRARAQPASQI
jgi:cellulose synthase/poly-beta-1,6-N-acetylglucosamine synthase-like glycosyltransferase